jgi:hypothetical protein
MTTHPPRADGRHCIKCGREIGPEETICEFCNRAGMATPAASQYHGTVAVAIIAAVAALAIAGTLSLRGVGPYASEVLGVGPAEVPGYAVTFAVTNEGTKAGRAKCQILALGENGRRLRARNTLTPQIPGGGTVEQVETLPGLEDEPASVRLSCS